MVYTKYDYHPDSSRYLSADKKGYHYALGIMETVEEGLIIMGDKGFLTGKALKDYKCLKQTKGVNNDN